MTEYITETGSRMFLVPASTTRRQRVAFGAVQAAAGHNALPAPNGANNPNIAGPAGGNGANGATPADENGENVPPPRRNQRRDATQLSVRELRRRARAFNPMANREREPRYRRVLGDMNGQQVRDLREFTFDEVNGNGVARSDYIDLNNGRIPDAAVLQDPYSHPSTWTTFADDA